ncbi:cytoplasmic dynein 2 heavy chain 1-like [Dysidea avara]|uniref:cytoplasmic dynein 2 heavy chain 1-like n=1 Tax=Dysidea avara TaxID=196820 RepID=UPI00332741BF
MGTFDTSWGNMRSVVKSKSCLRKLNHVLEGLDKEVLELRTKFKQHATEAAKLKLDVDKGNETIGIAENMIGKLEGEYEGWSSQVKDLKEKLDQLPKRTLLAAGFITYLSQASEGE